MPNVGDAAPVFSLPRDGGGEIDLAGCRPSPVVLFFYPKDDTSGCTKEALGFTALKPEFDALGVVLLGVSKDPVSKHDKFIAKHGLQVILGSDAESDVCEQYDVWKEKSMYGRTYMGIERSTFLIDGHGAIAAAWRKVKVPGHVEAVLEACRSL